MRRDRVLLVLRGSGIYRGGEWGLPSGEVMPSETYVGVARRKLRSEVGLEADVPLRFVHLLERVTPTGDHWVGAFFAVVLDAFDGFEPVNAEPHKHDAVSWFGVGELPGNLGDYLRHAIDAVRRAETFSEFVEP